MSLVFYVISRGCVLVTYECVLHGLVRIIVESIMQGY